jgi:ATP-binding cassette subfamily B protein
MERDNPPIHTHSPRQEWWKSVQPRWRTYALGLSAMFVTNGTEVLAPKALQWTVDALLQISSSSSSLLPLIRAVTIFFGIALIGMVGRIFWRLTLAKMTHVYGREIKTGIWRSLGRSKLEEISRFTLGDLMNRAIGDLNSARWIFGFTLVLTCDVLFFTVLGAASMIWIHPGLAFACLVSFAVIPPVAIILARKEYDAHDRAQDELTVLSQHVSQSVRGVRAQRASHAFGMWVRALSESATRYSGLRLDAQRIAILGFPVFSLPTLVSYGVLLYWGPALVVARELTVGEFTAFASYVYLLQGPLGELGDLIAEWQRGFASLRRIYELHALDKSDTMIAGDLSHNQVALECREVHVSRQGRSVLSEVNLQVGSGEWVGISGSVGGGKSTLLRVLSGIESPTKGRVRLNSSLCSGLISYVPERPFIFSGTIRKNLSLNQDYNDDLLWKYLGIVQMSDQVRKMGGLDAFVGEGGVTLSGGQKQRLSLARSLLRANGLIIMDDPISAVDPETEVKILAAMRREFSGHAVVMASNKRPTLDCCDRVFSLDAQRRGADSEVASWQ